MVWYKSGLCAMNNCCIKRIFIPSIWVHMVRYWHSKQLWYQLYQFRVLLLPYSDNIHLLWFDGVL